MINVTALAMKAKLEVKLAAVADTFVEVTARGERKFTLHLPLVTCQDSLKVRKLENFFGRKFEKTCDELGTFIYFEV